MGSSGGGSSKVEYTQSPEQRQIMQAAMPMFQGMMGYGQERYFGGAPQMGAPSMSGVLTGQNMYDIPGYNIPNMNIGSYNVANRNVGGYNVAGRNVGGYNVADPTSAMPTGQWWQGLSPQVKQGLYAPYVEAGQGLLEQLGGRGQLGSPGAGYSGAAGAALGKLAGEAAQNVGLNAWQMTSPAAMANLSAQNQRSRDIFGEQSLAGRDIMAAQNLRNRDIFGEQSLAGREAVTSQNQRNRDIWQAQTGAGRDLWQAGLMRNMGMWGEQLGRNKLGYQQGQQESLADYNTAMNVWGMPASFINPGMQMGMPQGMVQQGGGGGFGSMLGGGLMGGLGGSMIPASMGLGPWGMIGGAALGGLAGLFGR